MRTGFKIAYELSAKIKINFHTEQVLVHIFCLFRINYGIYLRDYPNNPY